MKRLHNQEKQQFQKLFSQEDIDSFEDRFKVLEVFLQTERHVTASELAGLLKEDGHPLETDSIRDALKLMCRYGFARKNRFDNGEIRYEHLHLGYHHDHMICTKCKAIIEFTDNQLEKLQAQIADSHGFHILQHKMEIYGICSKCLKDREQLIPLVTAKQGERLRIEGFDGGARFRMRLLTMGLRPGDEIEVVNKLNKGQLVISADFKRYVIGRGMTQKILVRPIKFDKP
jgi:Fur family ferric uptake transcriptional regulator